MENQGGVNNNNNGGQDVVRDEYFQTFPPGYRFQPTDEELVVYYLRNKVLCRPLPKHRIPNVNLYLYHPDQLSEMYELLREEERYFFTPRDRKYPKGSRPNRVANNGYWKATAADTVIYSHGQIVGYRKSLVFYEGQARSGRKTNWLMQEYTLQKHNTPISSRDPNNMKLDEWVLCKIYHKQRARNPQMNNQQPDEMQSAKHNDNELMPNAYDVGNPQMNNLQPEEMQNANHNDDELMPNADDAPQPTDSSSQSPQLLLQPPPPPPPPPHAPMYNFEDGYRYNILPSLDYMFAYHDMQMQMQFDPIQGDVLNGVEQKFSHYD